MPYWHNPGTMGWAGGIGMLVLMALVLVALVVVLLRRAPQPPMPGGTARRILDERFARGELDEEEYRRRRAVLGAS